MSQKFYSSPFWPDYHLWRLPSEQLYTSQCASVNSAAPAAGFKEVTWQAGWVNADIGGGKYDNATEYLATLGVENIIYDPFNRSFGWNKNAVARIHDGRAHSVTVFNVLNVIMEIELRDMVIRQAANSLTPGGHAVFQIYEGNRSGTGTPTTRGWQANLHTRNFLPEITRHFSCVSHKGNILIASHPSP